MTHTPGPWETSSCTSVFSDLTDWDVCMPGGGDMICDLRHTDNAEANANLIAAAPDLLAALRECNIFMKIARQHFPKSIKDADRFALEQTCAAIGTAIAKAEGRS